jgi:hypothetical protein
MEQQTGQSNPSNKNFLIIVLTAVIAALVSGGAVFLWQQSIINQITDESSKEKQSLEKQIEFLQMLRKTQGLVAIPQNVLESIQKLSPGPQTSTKTSSATNTASHDYIAPANDGNEQGSVLEEAVSANNGVKIEVVNGIKDYVIKENKYLFNYQEILKALYPDNSEKILYSTDTGHIGGLKLSPDGRYLVFNVNGYGVRSTVSMLNVKTGKYVFSPDDGNNIAIVGEIKWSADSNNFVMDTRVNDMEGEGEEGVYVSEYNNPDKFKKIWTAPNRWVTKTYTEIKNVNFVGNDKLNFDVEQKVDTENSPSKSLKYEYDFRQDKLTSVN